MLIRPGSVLKPKPKPRFWGRTERKPKLRFWRGYKSVLTCLNGLTEDVADSLNDVVLNHFRSAEQHERDDCQSAVGGRMPHVGKCPLSASLKPGVHANKSHLTKTI